MSVNSFDELISHQTRGDNFTREEVSSIYVEPTERYVVSLIVSYNHDTNIGSPKDAAYYALQLTKDGDQSSTNWFVYDRQTKTMHQLEQGDFEGDEW